MKVTGIESFCVPSDYPPGHHKYNHNVGLLLGQTDITMGKLKELQDDGYVLFLRVRTDSREEIQEAVHRLRKLT